MSRWVEACLGETEAKRGETGAVARKDGRGGGCRQWWLLEQILSLRSHDVKIIMLLHHKIIRNGCTACQ